MKPLKFKMDENLPLEIADIFTNASYDTKTVLRVYIAMIGERDAV